MNHLNDAEYVVSLIHELRSFPQEAEWVEFKHNNDNPERIGQYISGLANSAALLGKVNAYVVWGIQSDTHEVIGTSFRPNSAKVGNEELENWLLRQLEPKINFRFVEVPVEGLPVVLLEIGAAFRHPVRFQGFEHIRVGTYLKRLKDFPEKEREIWRVFDRVPFERGVAVERLDGDEVLRVLDYPAYFDLLELPLPDGRAAILAALKVDGLIQDSVGGAYDITNLGAILFAKRLDDFPTLKRKAMRVIQYKGKGRVETLREQIGGKGYANGFEGLIGFIMALVPSNEVIGQALRKSLPMYPELAVRELVANAIIHQDFFILGSGPMLELFEDRLEITNPGVPLVATDRFVDTPPKSRNEALASLMRRFRICEERGSGIDKVVSLTEYYQLPAPLFEKVEDHTRVVLFAHREFKDMDKRDRIWACYLHACLRYVERDFMTNTTLRGRFGISSGNSSMASRIIRDSLDTGKIRCHDESVGAKAKKYLPWWA